MSQDFNTSRISASRVNKYLGCGVEFKRYYIDGDPEEISGSAALFGNVMHEALEHWALNRSQDLVTLTAQAWASITEGTPVRAFIGEYQAISVECMKAEKVAREKWEADPRNKGKVSKAPRMTKHFKESAAAKKLDALLAKWIPVLNDKSPWRFSDRDPLPSLYDESLILAKKYAAKRGSLPTSLHTEFGFDVEWNGFTLTGYIDSIEPVLSDEGELLGYAVVDYKTYRAEPARLKDWRQAVIYDVAFHDLCCRGVLPFDPELPRWVVFDYVRLGVRKDFAIGEQDYAELLRDLTMYRAGVEAGVFLPAHKNTNPDFCSYGETCCLRQRGECGQPGGLYQEAA